MTLNSNENLLEAILSKENINAAWKHVRANKGAAGIDGITVDDFVQQFKAVGDTSRCLLDISLRACWVEIHYGPPIADPHVG
ncbi:hypothetical protein ACG1BZ_21360 [Microbulbifer sp. CNSA002]|uniref:hypothetical protein n=1 Tax=Microbulbifer sp. CNSA002 TaxID=3373604 RepID=UPI0039B43F71